jgi:hypothetical protein
MLNLKLTLSKRIRDLSESLPVAAQHWCCCRNMARRDDHLPTSSGLSGRTGLHTHTYHHSRHRGNVTALYWRPNRRSRLHFGHDQDGGPRSLYGHVAALGKKYIAIYILVYSFSLYECSFAVYYYFSSYWISSFKCHRFCLLYRYRKYDILWKGTGHWKILNNYLKITGILNNVFRQQKALKKTRIKVYNTLAGPPSVVIWQRNMDCYSKGR